MDQEEQGRAGRSVRTVKANDLVIAKLARTKLDKQGEWYVEGERGLSVVIKPEKNGQPGVASYYVRYQIGKGERRKQVRAVLGRAGETGMPLSKAREKARAMMREVASGLDPVAEQRARDASLTLRQLFAERLSKDKETAPRTLEDYDMALKKDVFDELGDQPANEIKPEDFARVLERVQNRKAHAAHKVRSALGSTYRWGQGQWRDGVRLVVVNPVAGLGFMHQSAPRRIKMTADQLAKVWTAIDATPALTEPTRLIIKLAILTGQRNSEVAGAEASELVGLNSANPRWDIPARRMKRKSEDQHVPLVPQAVALFSQALELARGSQYVFPGVTQGRRRGREWRQEHIGQETVSRAFGKVAAAAGIDDLHLHDMRKIISSWLAENGHAPKEVLDAILHHGKEGVTGKYYNFALYEVQVRAALQKWADHIDRIVSAQQGEGAGNVVALARP